MIVDATASPKRVMVRSRAVIRGIQGCQVSLGLSAGAAATMTIADGQEVTLRPGAYLNVLAGIGEVSER